LIFLEQEELELSPMGLLAPAETRRDDFGVVEDEDIPRAEVLGEVGEAVMVPASGGAVQDEQAGLRALAGGALGDQFRRQREIEFRGVHGLVLAEGRRENSLKH
jgi:hypothetical protein